MAHHSPDSVRAFFERSSWLDYVVLKPLSHIAAYWEIRWDDDSKCYQPEVGSFAGDLNIVIGLLAECPRPAKYHEYEDILAESVLLEKKWPIQKRGSRWVGADYAFILEQGSFKDINQRSLITAATGRVHAALDFGQRHFDIVEDGHFYMLSALITIIIYQRYCAGDAVLIESD